MNTTNSASILQVNFSEILSYVSTLGIGGLVGTIFGYWFKDKLAQNAENKRKIREGKERQYKDLLSNVLAFFDGWEDKDCQKQFLRELYTNAPVYASDEVIRLSNKFLKGFDKEKPQQSKERDVIYGQLVLEIRKELNKIQGNPTTELSIDDIKIQKLNK